MTRHIPNRPLSRRRFLAAYAGAIPGYFACGARAAAPGALDATVLTLPARHGSSRKALVLTPRTAPRKGGRSVLVLLHGLGETASESLGLHAWSDRYGLIEADARLRRGSVAPPVPNRYLSESRALAIDQELRRRPYSGPVLVCPVTPNVYKGGGTYAALEEYAAWIADVLLPAVRETAGVGRDPAATAIDGCSLGGYVAIEVFLRRPEAFGALGSVQAAIGERMAFVYAGRLRAVLDRVGPRQIHVESSVWDPSRKAHEILSAELDKHGVPHDLTVLPGGHDQMFLREIGALEMLLWHDRRISR
jgi:pimeloyl-ACP methyl ester carboxylesterase